MRIRGNAERPNHWRGRHVRKLLGIAGLSISLAGVGGVATAESAEATGRGIVAGPSFTAIQVDWQTVSKTATVENLWVQVTGTTLGRTNQCGTGMSIWYYDANWVRRNIYQARDYCTWGPVFSFWTPTFSAKRGSCV